MKIGIIGLPQVGKKTLFEALTGHTISEHELAANKPILSFAPIRDPRFDLLCRMYAPKKDVRAKVDVEILPKLEQEAIRDGGIFENIVELDALCHVVRAFADEAVYHAYGSVDPVRDIQTINGEFLLHDLVFVEKRLERLDKDLKKTPNKNAALERDLLLRCKGHLEQEKPLRLLPIGDEEARVIASYPFITRKPMIVVLNVGEGMIATQDLCRSIDALCSPQMVRVIQVAAKTESEIVKLETAEERAEFLTALGIREPAMDLLTRELLSLLRRISFFTVGPDEVRQWTVRQGALAPEAAGVIHSDLQRGFIRAEVMKYTDLAEAGAEEKVKQAGRLYLKGKDYPVEDGDILTIRFSV